MLIYEYRIRDEFDRVRDYAKRLRESFEEGRKATELLRDAENLKALCESLTELLPVEIRDSTNLFRHLGFMLQNLRTESPQFSKGDIRDICDLDLIGLESRFRTWVRQAGHYDEDLVRQTSDLIVRREYDSAVRKAFVILKERIAKRFAVPSDIDGEDLVNQVFGSTPHPSLRLGNAERQAWRNLLAGLFGVFRNRFAHSTVNADWHEADAVLSMVNHVVKRLDSLVSRSKRAG